MYQILGSMGYGGVGLFMVVLIVTVVFLFKAILRHNEDKMIATKEHTNELDKKHFAVDLNKYKPLLSRVGLAISLLVVWMMFEVPQFEKQELVDLGTVEAEPEEMIEIPPTQHQPPPPPKIKQPEIVEIPEDEEIEEEIDVDLDMEFDEEEVVEEIVEEEVEEEEVVEQVFDIVEETAAPPGGMAAFYKGVGDKMKYPSKARRMGVEGRVYVQFVVDKDGSITEVKAIRGIGAGCDEEAVRVVSSMPKWSPGKQRGRPVKQRIVLPINFKLG